MTYREARTFIRKNFTDGEYTGDNGSMTLSLNATWDDSYHGSW